MNKCAKKHGIMCKKMWRKVQKNLSIEGAFVDNLLNIAFYKFGMKIAYIQKRNSNCKLDLFESL
jgi:hypothetical protein